jgi:hypothetical protein
MPVNTSNVDFVHLLLAGITDASALSVTLSTLEAGVASALSAVNVSTGPLAVVKALNPSEAEVLAACAKTRVSRGLVAPGGVTVFSHTPIAQLRVRAIASTVDVTKIDSATLASLRAFSHTLPSLADYDVVAARALATAVAPAFGLKLPGPSTQIKGLLGILFGCKAAMLSAGILAPPQMCSKCNKVWHCTLNPPQVHALCHDCSGAAPQPGSAPSLGGVPAPGGIPAPGGATGGAPSSGGAQPSSGSPSSSEPASGDVHGGAPVPSGAQPNPGGLTTAPDLAAQLAALASIVGDLVAESKKRDAAAAGLPSTGPASKTMKVVDLSTSAATGKAVPLSCSPAGVPLPVLLYGPGGHGYSGVGSARPPIEHIVLWLRLHLSSCVVSQDTLELWATDPVSFHFSLEAFAGKHMPLPISSWDDFTTTMSFVLICVEKLFCEVVRRRFQRLLDHLVKERACGLGPPSVSQAAPWLSAAVAYFFLQASAHSTWLDNLLPPMELPAVASVRSDLDRLWRRACLPLPAGGPPSNKLRGARDNTAAPVPKVDNPGGSGRVAFVALPRNSFGDTVRGNKVPKCVREKTKDGGFKSLCVRASLTSDKKCPTKHCRFSHARHLTSDELRECLYFASTEMPAGAAALKD